MRRLCDCRTVDETDSALLQGAGFTADEINQRARGDWVLYKATGCTKCHHTGYKGRVGVFEVLQVSPALQQLMLNHASARDMALQAQKEGVYSLRRAGLEKVMTGITSLSEVLTETERSEDRGD